ncbi:hypothetical protein EYZ11_004015 [Aspergillus tanneri]|uniref:Protein kinase domain-containing protein n=1 Tax=Aspergillus tanneri TaxID=1220188 RepID=A0A4S3JLQ5_9EURO|nr:uncharacterized protein ATNIH1004_007395 [Aspergillus tanneri]KAA8645974.1 hypothetical protein ATNIH1004_007395 [Aspergillus tanneri]THC96516.1 hypothetical protein EYZ11_004015 [Aspergillus tanneri]
MPGRLSVRTKDKQGDTAQGPQTMLSSLTPPVTPIKAQGSASGSENRANHSCSTALPSPVSAEPKEIDLTTHTVTTPLEYSDELEYHYDVEGHPVEYGSGVWSVVYEASSRTGSSSPLISPPSSPVTGSHLVAVKSPVRRDAYPVLEAEALILTRISMMSDSERHVVPFHGYISNTHSIVMLAVPLSFASYIEEQATSAQKHQSTKTMFEPIQGLTQWQDLAEKLITSLYWLHMGPQIIHGDIKPHNILLKPKPSTCSESADDFFPFDPLFADFSSAHSVAGTSLFTEKQKHTGTALTALTPPFAAPELLCISSLTSAEAAPTPASDVFSLAVTLLAAATGDLLLYPGTSHMQRLAMAREGHRVIEFARSGPNGARVPRNGVVERILLPAITKEPTERIQPEEWLRLVRSMR